MTDGWTPEDGAGYIPTEEGGSGREHNGWNVVAYEMEVKGPYDGWKTHYVAADDCPENPEEKWRDDHEVRNVRPLTYADEVPEEGQMRL